MKKHFLLIAPVAMLALAACSKTETPPAGDAAGTDTAATTTPEPVKLPPAITSKGVFRCADNTILYVDFLGQNEAADIRVGSDTATAIRVSAEAPAADAAAPAATDAAKTAEAKPAGALKSADGATMLTGSGKQINVKLADKGGQTCKAN